ncbi:MAG: GyrI-like domain-containing protein, partial [Pseudomonadota bacterium]
LITDFRQWPSWSPWTIQEPSCTLEYTGETHATGSGFSWDGEQIGAGGMTLLDHSESRIDCDLKFTRPFKSQADVSFHLEELGENQCKLTWDMRSSMPFFLFFMIPNIKLYVGMDYERGLRMLKELAETGSVASQVAFVGEQDLPQTHYLGIEVDVSLAEIPTAMEKHSPAMAALIDAEKLGQAGVPFSDNLHVDMKHDQHRMLIGIPISSTASREIGEYKTGVRPAYRCARFDHTGAYEHLGNAWATAMGWMRHHKRKAHKGSVGIELYTSDPAETTRAEIATELYIPLRQ